VISREELGSDSDPEGEKGHDKPQWYYMQESNMTGAPIFLPVLCICYLIHACTMPARFILLDLMALIT
jgi:hypothetical protein